MLRSDKYSRMPVLWGNDVRLYYMLCLSEWRGTARMLQEDQKDVCSLPLWCVVKLRYQIEWAEHMISSV